MAYMRDVIYDESFSIAHTINANLTYILNCLTEVSIQSQEKSIFRGTDDIISSMFICSDLYKQAHSIYNTLNMPW